MNDPATERVPSLPRPLTCPFCNAEVVIVAVGISFNTVDVRCPHCLKTCCLAYPPIHWPSI